jgi:DNA-directed RNA polymerase specialized sigma24 family protein
MDKGISIDWKAERPESVPNLLKTIAVNTAKDWLKSRAHKESQATDEIQPQQLWGSAMTQYQRQQWIEKIRDAIDSQKTGKEAPAVPSSGGAGVGTWGNSEIRNPKSEFRSLSGKNRQVVLDFYICGYSASEISQRLRIPLSTVNYRLKEARKQLREEFESMVAMSSIQRKFAPDTLVQNVMDRVISLPTPIPKGNIVERIIRMLPKENLPTIGIATLIAFAVIGLLSINLGNIHLGGNGN